MPGGDAPAPRILGRVSDDHDDRKSERALDSRPIAQRVALLAAIAATSWLIVPLFFVPRELVRWLAALRGIRRETNTVRAAYVFLAVAGVPGLCTAIALTVASEHGADALPRLIASAALIVVLAAPFVRAPLLFVDTPSASFGAVMRTAFGMSADAPLLSLALALLHATATGAAFVLGRTFAQRADGPWALAAIALALALLPVLWTPIVWLVSGATPSAPPSPRARRLVTMTAFLVPGLAAVLTLGAVATREPLPLRVLRDGRGIQEHRGLPREDTERGQLVRAGFRLEGRAGSLRVAPRAREPYDVAAAYDPSLARITALPDGAGALTVLLDGPDWRMELIVDEEGRRLDDAPLDRSLARVGRTGTVALALGLAAMLATLVLVMRAMVRLRRMSGAGFRHRLTGRLRLGDDSSFDGETLSGARNVVELLDGSAMFRLPEQLVPLAIDRALLGSLDGAAVVVATDRAPAIATHRSAHTPWPAAAQLVIGAPGVVARQAIERAARPIATMLACAQAITSLSLLAIAWG